MKAEAYNPETHQIIAINLSENQSHALGALKTDHISDFKLDAIIDNLNFSADAKAIIADIKSATIKLGGQIIRIGKRVLEIVLAIINSFPNTSFGFVLGLLIGALVGSIPLLGIILGPLLAPLIAAFGLAVGYAEDLKDKALERKIAEATARFEPLRGTES